MKYSILIAFLLCVSVFSQFQQRLERNYQNDLYTKEEIQSLPQSFSWDDINGTSYLTKSGNQHIPQYCGSCWAWAPMSALSDRLKIARMKQPGGSKHDYLLSVQYVCSCVQNKGDPLAVYQYVHSTPQKGWPYDSCNQYMGCMFPSQTGVCHEFSLTCNAMQSCRTCAGGPTCSAIANYPNATISAFGSIQGADTMMAEIYNRGTIACVVNSEYILNYPGGVINAPNASKQCDHCISIVGWGYDQELAKQYWIIRNSWGEYWGEMGYFRVVLGENQLGLESNCQWATLESFSQSNKPCDLSGANCQA